MFFLRLFFLLVLTFPNFVSAYDYGNIRINDFKWSVTKDGVKINSISASVTSTPQEFLCEKEYDKCGLMMLATSLASENNPGTHIFSSGPVSSYTTQVAVSALNSMAGNTLSYAQLGIVDPPTAVCIFFVEGMANANADYSPDWQMSTIPGECSGGGIPPQPTPTVCKVTGDVTIDYGSLTTDGISGRHKTGTTSISCDNDATVTMRVYNNTGSTNIVQLRSDKSISAKLTVDGKDISSVGERVDVKANVPAEVTIDSELEVSGIPEAGDFSGSALIVIAIP